MDFQHKKVLKRLFHTIFSHSERCRKVGEWSKKENKVRKALKGSQLANTYLYMWVHIIS